MYFVLPFRFLASFFVSYPCKLFETWNEWVKNIKNNTSNKIFFITFSFHPIWIIVNLDRKYFSSFCYDIGYGMIFLIWDIQSIFSLISPLPNEHFFPMWKQSAVLLNNLRIFTHSYHIAYQHILLIGTELIDLMIQDLYKSEPGKNIEWHCISECHLHTYDLRLHCDNE